MSVCLKSKNSIKTETWSNIFTNFNTDTKSFLFMKQLTHSCISTILYLRKIFPDDYFESKDFEGMSFKILKPGKNHVFIGKIEKWLEGAFEAIEKKYLKHLMLDIQDANSNMTLEIYTMTFHYQNEKDSLNFFISSDSNKKGFSEFTTENTKSTTIKLLQMCYAVTETYNSLPGQISLGMRLSYHEGTPAEYQPKGYVAWEAVDPVFPKMTRSIEIGVTGTQHHLFKLVNKSCFNDKFFKDMEKFSEKDQCIKSVLPLDDTNDVNDTRSKAKRELRFDNSKENTKPTAQQIERKYPEISVSYKPKQPSNKTPTKKPENRRDIPKKNLNSTVEVRCPCNSSEKSEVMFLCLSCRRSVHPECFGILLFDSSKKLKRFYCHLCHKPDSDFKCPDKIMVNIKNSQDKQKVAVLRRVLKFCYAPNIISITLRKMEKIAGPNCSKNVVEIVLNKMIEIGVAVPQGKKKTLLIDKTQLERKLEVYFYRSQNFSQLQSKVQ